MHNIVTEEPKWGGGVSANSSRLGVTKQQKNGIEHDEQSRSS